MERVQEQGEAKNEEKKKKEESTLERLEIRED
jgi:hypothetical protein